MVNAFTLRISVFDTPRLSVLAPFPLVKPFGKETEFVNDVDVEFTVKELPLIVPQLSVGQLKEPVVNVNTFVLVLKNK